MYLVLRITLKEELLTNQKFVHYNYSMYNTCDISTWYTKDRADNIVIMEKRHAIKCKENKCADEGH